MGNFCVLFTFECRKFDAMFLLFFMLHRTAAVPELATKVQGEVQHFDVVVIGAGIAGLGAAKVLKEAKVNFVVLEGSDRVGGRINTVDMENLTKDSKKVSVDSGAQWLHGKNNELFKFAEKHSLIRPELSEEAQGDYIRDDGTKLDEYFVKKVDFKFGQILEECEDFAAKKGDKSHKFPSSLKEFVEEKFQVFVESLESEEEKLQAMQLLDWHRKFVSIGKLILNNLDLNHNFCSKSSTTHVSVSTTSRPKIGGIIPSMVKAVRRTSTPQTA